jgi:hypothetical protein
VRALRVAERLSANEAPAGKFHARAGRGKVNMRKEILVEDSPPLKPMPFWLFAIIAAALATAGSIGFFLTLIWAIG